MKQETLYPLKLNKDYYVVTANDLIKGRQRMTVQESKLLMIAMAQVVKEDKDIKTYTTTVPEIARFLGIDKSDMYRDIKEICKSLLQRIVEVKIGENKKSWKIFQWVNSAQYEGGKLTIRLSDEIKPFILELSSHYTQYQLNEVLSFKSYYTTRLYQLLKCEYGEKWEDKDEWSFTCDELREFFQTGKKYELPRNLVNKTIKIAISELNNSPHVLIYDYEEIKSATRGNPLQGVRFRALFFDNQKQKDRWINYSQLKLDEGATE